MNPKRQVKRQRDRARRTRQVQEVRNRRGDLIPVDYDPDAPTLTRVVKGLETSRVRTVRINGWKLTLNEVPNGQ